MANNNLLSTNLTGIPTAYFASPAFNISPIPTHINGVLEMNRQLFDALDKMGKEEIAPLFINYMRVMFELEEQSVSDGKRRFLANYLRLLRGWHFDSNRPEGAVMKGWVESRFGLRPLFHIEPVTDINSPAYYRYLMEKMSPRFHNNAIYSQFDLLYEYCQCYLKRFGGKKGRITLYRGVNRIGDEQQIIEKREKRLWVVRNNCLVSYARDLERASEFGDTVLKIEVPFEKILCFNDLLPGKLPSYESEYLVIGGNYLSEVLEV